MSPGRWQIFRLDVVSECVLNWENTAQCMKCTYVLLSEMCSILRLAKVTPCLTCPGVFRILCELLKVHQRGLWLCHSEYLVITEQMMS
jgi:hypothetical protein